MSKSYFYYASLLLLLSVMVVPNIQAQIFQNRITDNTKLLSKQSPFFNLGKANNLSIDQKNPTINAQKRSFLPSETVTINGVEFDGYERVRLRVTQLKKHTDDLLIREWDEYADAKGRVSTTWDLNNEVPDASDFEIAAVGTNTGKLSKTYVSTSTLVGETISQLTQCANGPGLPQGQSCPEVSSTGWVSGNVGASKSQYIEGDSIAYRVILDNLDVGDVYQYTFGWDVTKGGLNAIDYLTTYNRSITGANPCKGTSESLPAFHCNQGSPDSVVPIPVDTIMTAGVNQIDEGGGGDDVNQIPGVLTMWGGDMVESATNDCSADVGVDCGLSPYVYTSPGTFPAGDESASITITFRALNTKMVLAWGGHIATRSDWGRPQGSVNITGSPYHMFNMSGDNLTEGTTNIFSGNREVQLSTASIIVVGRLIIYKHVSPSISSMFNFSGDFSSSNYTSGSTVQLEDTVTDFGHSPSGVNPSVPASPSDDQSWTSNGITDFTSVLTVTEVPASGFSSDGIACSVTEDFDNNNDTVFPNGATKGSGNNSMELTLGTGDEVTCTFFSSFTTAAGVSMKGRVFDSSGLPLSRAVVTITDSEGISRNVTTNQFGNFRFDEIEAGTSLLLNVNHRNYQFAPQLLTVNDNLESVEVFPN